MITTSLIPLDIIFPDVCAFIIGFNCIMWTKMRSLACSLVDGMLADAVLISPCSLIPPTNIRKGGRRKSKETSNRNNIYK